MEKQYSWKVLEENLSSNLINKISSIKGKNFPDLLVFKPTFFPDPDLYEQEIQSLSSRTKDTIDGSYQGQFANDKHHGIGIMTYKKSSDCS